MVEYIAAGVLVLGVAFFFLQQWRKRRKGLIPYRVEILLLSSHLLDERCQGAALKLDRADYLRGTGKTREAITVYSEIAETFMSSDNKFLQGVVAESICTAGCMYSELGEEQKALHEFDRLLDAMPDDEMEEIYSWLAGARFERARIYYDKGKKKEAESDAREVRRVCRDGGEWCRFMYVSISINLSKILYGEERTEEAITLLEETKDATRNEFKDGVKAVIVILYSGLIDLYNKMGEMDQAFSELNEMLERFSSFDDEESKNWIAASVERTRSAYMRKGMPHEAERLAREITEKYPEFLKPIEAIKAYKLLEYLKIGDEEDIRECITELPQMMENYISSACQETDKYSFVEHVCSHFIECSYIAERRSTLLGMVEFFKSRCDLQTEEFYRVYQVRARMLLAYLEYSMGNQEKAKEYCREITSQFGRRGDSGVIKYMVKYANQSLSKIYKLASLQTCDYMGVAPQENQEKKNSCLWAIGLFFMIYVVLHILKSLFSK